MLMIILYYSNSWHCLCTAYSSVYL